MAHIKKALQHLTRSISEHEQHPVIPLEEFVNILVSRPHAVIRNVFQVFYDMIKSYVGEGVDEYPDDPETINFVSYDCRRLFIENSDHPFFADRLFANRLIRHVESMQSGAQQNKIYIFKGPPGSGKSTFLNNLLTKFEEYANTDEGMRFETVWRLDRKKLGRFPEREVNQFLDKLSNLLDEYELNQQEILEARSSLHATDDYIEVPCPSHDNPLLMIPKAYRRPFFDDLFRNDEFKWKLFTEKEYEWVFKDSPCTICSALYEALLARLKQPTEVYQLIHARPYRFNRRLGEGISVFNPGDQPMMQTVLTNEMLQRRVDDLLRDSNQVKYIFSRFARTNNGIYALMDIKSHNAERLIELHNIISEGVHKVEDLEENVNSLFLALMNPEDEKAIEGFPSFSDRIEYISIPYIMDLNTEVEIYRNIFGRHIDTSFLPRVLHNFARVIISTRMNLRSDALLEWIGDPDKYSRYCDWNLHLLKMEIYTGYIPAWLSEEDRKLLTAKRRRSIIAESEDEGEHGLSGRDAIKIFNEFYSTYVRKDRLISMTTLHNYFTVTRKDLLALIPEGFLDALMRNYNYAILQEVKESLYYYNEEQISRDIQNYMFAVNFEPGAVETCRFTGERLAISEEFMAGIEARLLGAGAEVLTRLAFRKDTQKEYASRTLTQEIMLEGLPITETKLYAYLYERYVHNLKEKVLEPFLENENFRRAIKDFDTEAFKTYDKRIRSDVAFLITNLGKKFSYSKLGAKEVCIYVIDNDLALKFTTVEPGRENEA
jgi:predicted Ser/Thr protein kinase